MARAGGPDGGVSAVSRRGADRVPARARAQRAFWDGVYRRDPDYFGRRPSPFARWALARLDGTGAGRSMVELGCGGGRDSAYFARRGFVVHAIDVAPHATDAAARSLARLRGGPGAHAVETDDARAALERRPPGSLDAVYSCLFLNMDFDRREHAALYRAARRALRPRGLHLYSVRSVDDPWYGRGRRVGPDRYRLGPGGPTVHFFSREYARTLAIDSGFRPEAAEGRAEGGREFPIRVMYVADRAVPPASAAPCARPAGLPLDRTPR